MTNLKAQIYCCSNARKDIADSACRFRYVLSHGANRPFCEERNHHEVMGKSE